MSFKPYCHVRIANLPTAPEMCKPNVSAIRADDAGCFLQVSGTVIRSGMVKMLESEREYECGNQRCGRRFKVQADIESNFEIEMPVRAVLPAGAMLPAFQRVDVSHCSQKQCPAVVNGKRCTSTKFRYVEDSAVCSDFQEVRIQEQVNKLGMGMIPRTITVLLENDLVDSVKVSAVAYLCIASRVAAHQHCACRRATTWWSRAWCEGDGAG